MKRSLILFGGFALLFAFASCNNGNEPETQPTEVQEVEISTVIPESKTENAVSHPQDEEGKKIFEENILSSISGDIVNTVNSIFSSNKTETSFPIK